MYDIKCSTTLYVTYHSAKILFTEEYIFEKPSIKCINIGKVLQAMIIRLSSTFYLPLLQSDINTATAEASFLGI